METEKPADPFPEIESGFWLQFPNLWYTVQELTGEKTDHQ